jgi:hypothetical protein
MSKEALVAVEGICQFIINNPKLVHLDLSYTEMQPSMMRMVIEAVSQSKSIMAVHLCGNPGIDVALAVDLLGAEQDSSVSIPIKNDAGLVSETI